MGNEVSGLRLGLRTLFCGQSINTDRNYCDFIRHFKGNAGILADHVKLLAFLCAVAIESESAVSTA